jgi:hypothetical protein
MDKQITWQMVDDGLRLTYVGSNGAVIMRKQQGSRLWHGRDRQHAKSYYYTLNNVRFYRLKDAKAEAENLGAN